MRTRQRTEKGHEVEIKILNKAVEIFRKSGYAEFRMADLSKETDMQLGAITYYYRKKTNILEKILKITIVQYTIFWSNLTGSTTILRFSGTFAPA